MSESQDFEKAVQAIRAGDLATGRRLLVAALKSNPKNEMAWLWLARALPDDQQRLAALEQCLKINPHSEVVRRAAAQLRSRLQSGAPPPPAGGWKTQETLAEEGTPPPSLRPSPPIQPAAPPSAPPPVTQPPPLSERISRQQPAASAEAGRPAVRPAGRPEVRPAGRPAVSPSPKSRPARRSAPVLELGLMLLVVAAASLLAWVVVTQNRSAQSDLARRLRLATAAALETENAALRQQIDARQTQAAAIEAATATPETTAFPTATPTPLFSATPVPVVDLPTTTIEPPGWIAPETIAEVVAQGSLPGDFYVDLDFSPQGDLLAAALDRSIQVWQADTLTLVWNSDLPGRALALAFAPDGGALYYAYAGEGPESYLSSVRVGDWQPLFSGVRSAHTILQLLPDPKGETLVMALYASNANLSFFDPGQMMVLGVLEHPGGVLGAGFHPQGVFLASGGYNDTVRVWEVFSRQVVSVLSGHAADVTDLAFSPDGERLATAAADGEIRLWEVANWRLVDRFSASAGVAQRLAFSRDGRLLFSGGEGGRLLAWDLATLDAIWTAEAPVGMRDLVLSPDGGRLAAAGEETLTVWSLPLP